MGPKKAPKPAARAEPAARAAAAAPQTEREQIVDPDQHPVGIIK